MIVKHAAGFVVFVGACLSVSAQAPAPAQRSGGDARPSGIVYYAGNVVFTADDGDVNAADARAVLRGVVTMRPGVAPFVRQLQAKNAAGAPFPDVPPVIMHFRGDFQIGVNNLTIRADEADVNARTGDTELRGNVTVLHSVERINHAP